MGRANKRPEIHISPERAALLKKVGGQLLIGGLFFGTLAAGFFYVKRYVDREVAMPAEPPSIVIKNKPQWMSEFLVQKIAATARPTGLHSAFDHQSLLQAKEALEANPWISKVYDVRRAFRDKPGDTLEIDCEYRVPTALVKWGAYYWLVDRDGFKLPEQYEPADVPKIVLSEDGKVNIRILDGVHHAPPATGKKWVGEDLAAGLEMVGLLAGKPYAQEIRTVNVSRFGNRREPHVVLVTSDNHMVYWGRTPSELDKDPFMEITTAQKLTKLEQIYAKFGRVDAGQSDPIDLRFDYEPRIGGQIDGKSAVTSSGT